MPKGVTEDGRWRGLAPLDAWVDAMQAEAPLCACGCGERIVVKRAHRHRGIPRFVHGHHARVEHGRYIGVDKWVEEQQGWHQCACGCGGLITVVERHHATGIPRYLHNHSPRPDLGHGADHPRYVHDRSLVKSRDGQYFTPWTMKLIHERCGGACVECGDTGGLEFDHIVPIALGGTGDPENGQLPCRACHKEKTPVDHVRAALARRCEFMLGTIDNLLAAIQAVAA